MTNRAVFLDRDGVVNALADDPVSGLPEGPLHVEQIELLPGVPDSLKRLRDAGFLLVCVTNQPGAAKGYVSVAELDAVNERVRELLRQSGIDFDLVEVCLHHPSGIDSELTQKCSCRKPEPGMLLAAAEKLQIDLAASWLVGDSDSDIEAARRAGCASILVTTAESAHRRISAEVAEHTASDLTAAVDLIVASDPT